ncbi:MAG: CvpA family protein [Pseudomonadota bacterium]|nr:CvpA family protein [Pseudomonadota bacterium]
MTWPLALDSGWVDLAMGGFLLLSVLVGLARGFVFELLSLVGWFAAYFAARWLGPACAAHVPVGVPGSALNEGVTFAGIFLLALVLWSLAARFVRTLVRATPLRGFDRVLGGGFGLVRGLLVLLLAATLIGLSPWARSPAWQASRGAAWLDAMLQQLRPYFSDDTPQHTTA